MKIIYKDFEAVYSIICPFCKFKQTGVVREYLWRTGELLTRKNAHTSAGGPAIKCCMRTLNGEPHCGRLITGDQLAEVTRHAIKSPSDFRS